MESAIPKAPIIVIDAITADAARRLRRYVHPDKWGVAPLAHVGPRRYQLRIEDIDLHEAANQSLVSASHSAARRAAVAIGATFSYHIDRASS